MWRYLLAWFGMAVIASANGALREFVLEPAFPNQTAYLLSTLILIALFALFFWWLFRRWPARSKGHAWSIGIIWLLLTLAFEFGLSVAGGLTWREMLAQYDLTAGNLWVLVPIFVATGPRLFYRQRRD